jgi:hypothetical protein
LGRIPLACRGNSPLAQIADSNSINAVSFIRAYNENAFHTYRAAHLGAANETGELRDSGLEFLSRTRHQPSPYETASFSSFPQLFRMHFSRVIRFHFP